MQVSVEFDGHSYLADLSQPLDISLPLRKGAENPSAWYCQPVEINPVINAFFTGSVALGGAVNFRDIQFNPHGHGTHTECVGHISHDWISVNDCLKQFHCLARLFSIQPEITGEDRIIRLASLQAQLGGKPLPEAVVIRTLPNDPGKKTFQYSNTNPPYLEKELLVFLAASGVKHLVLDLPSVDREVDEGILAGHHAFWNYPDAPRMDATITELAFIPDEFEDGLYLLNLMIAPFDNDASPSKPILYVLNPV